MFIFELFDVLKQAFLDFICLEIFEEMWLHLL